MLHEDDDDEEADVDEDDPPVDDLWNLSLSKGGYRYFIFGRFQIVKTIINFSPSTEIQNFIPNKKWLWRLAG